MTRALALDLGTRRIGLAVSDGAGTMAFPRAALARHAVHAADHAAVRRVVEVTGAEVVVVGLTLSLNGTSGPAAQAAAAEAAELETALAGLGVRVLTFDERLTTVSASGALAKAGKRGREQRESVDSAAATVLLEAWLATQRG